MLGKRCYKRIGLGCGAQTCDESENPPRSRRSTSFHGSLDQSDIMAAVTEIHSDTQHGSKDNVSMLGASEDREFVGLRASCIYQLCKRVCKI
jgi:hypothetical protein